MSNVVKTLCLQEETKLTNSYSNFNLKSTKDNTSIDSMNEIMNENRFPRFLLQFLSSDETVEEVYNLNNKRAPQVSNIPANVIKEEQGFNCLSTT